MPQQESTFAILAQAMQIEREGMAFYGQAAAQSQNPHVKALFQGLVTDETGHLRILQAEYDSLRSAGSWLPAEEISRQITTSLTLFPKSPEAITQAAASPSDLDAIKLAMDMEQKGYDLYVRAGKEAADADAQALYLRLARMESHHFKALQYAYGYLTHPDYWFDEEERPIFEG